MQEDDDDAWANRWGSYGEEGEEGPWSTHAERYGEEEEVYTDDKEEEKKQIKLEKDIRYRLHNPILARMQGITAGPCETKEAQQQYSRCVSGGTTTEPVCLELYMANTKCVPTRGGRRSRARRSRARRSTARRSTARRSKARRRKTRRRKARRSTARRSITGTIR